MRFFQGLENTKMKNCCKIGSYECQRIVEYNGVRCGIDACILDVVCALNSAGIETVASCCGHGDESLARIDLRDGRTIRIENHTPIKHRKPFLSAERLRRLTDYVFSRGLVSVRKAARIMDCQVEDITEGL